MGVLQQFYKIYMIDKSHRFLYEAITVNDKSYLLNVSSVCIWRSLEEVDL